MEHRQRRPGEAYGTAVRTTLRNNATAYGFSISVTAAFSLATSASGNRADVAPTFLFAVGAVLAFVTIGGVTARYAHAPSHTDGENVVLISGAIDMLSVLAAIGAAALTTLVGGLGLWPLAGFATTAVYLLVGGLDVLIARRVTPNG